MKKRTIVTIMAFLVSVALFVAAPHKAAAQESADIEQWEKPYPLSIQDNSFFIEEAFNQEEGVVQHISTLTAFPKFGRDVGYSFTQEWPLGGVTHQLSFEIPLVGLGSESGIGDLAINYRYQLLDKVDGIAVAPRLSLILPTGDDDRGLGAGVTGIEANIPASKRLSDFLVVHANAGVTLFPNSKGTDLSGSEIRRTLSSYAAGASAIVLAHPNINLMLEYVATFSSGIGPSGEVSFETSHVVSPGVRAAVNIDKLQIVPGIAVPFRFSEAGSETGIFGYLSFEHGF